jgi:hypothetical protein
MHLLTTVLQWLAATTVLYIGAMLVYVPLQQFYVTRELTRSKVITVILGITMAALSVWWILALRGKAFLFIVLLLSATIVMASRWKRRQSTLPG